MNKDILLVSLVRMVFIACGKNETVVNTAAIDEKIVDSSILEF